VKRKKVGSVMGKLRAINAKRSSFSRVLDNSLANKRTVSSKKLTGSSLRRWVKTPGSMDIRGIDTKRKGKAKRRK